MFSMFRPYKHLLLSLWLLDHCRKLAVAQADEGMDEEMEIESWFDLVRYLLGISFVIVGILSLVYEPIATRFFLRRFDKPKCIEKVSGVVLSCDEMEGVVKKFELQVQYSAPYLSQSHHKRHGDQLLERKFVKRIASNWKTPRGSNVELIVLKNIPRSACTRDWVEEEKARVSCAKIANLVLLIPAIGLLLLLLTLSVREILTFPERSMVFGWSSLAACLIGVTWLSWSFVDHRFEASLKDRVLTAVPVKEDEQQEVEEGPQQVCLYNPEVIC